MRVGWEVVRSRSHEGSWNKALLVALRDAWRAALADSLFMGREASAARVSEWAAREHGRATYLLDIHRLPVVLWPPTRSWLEVRGGLPVRAALRMSRAWGEMWGE